MELFIFYSSRDRGELEEILARGACERLAPQRTPPDLPMGDSQARHSRLDQLEVVRVPESRSSGVVSELERMRSKVGSGRLIYVAIPQYV
jgi:hypothetical protein